MAILSILVLTAYLNCLKNDFVSDDIGAIKNSPDINSVRYFWQPPYYNLNFRSVIIYLTNRLFGLDPLFFHLGNIFFHLGAVLTAFLLLRSLSPPPIPFMAAALFAVHPIMTESVTWISGGPYSFAGFLTLLSFLFYLIYRQKRKKFFYLISFFIFCQALISLEKIIIFPLILTAFELSFPLEKTKKTIPRLLPYWLASFLWAFHLTGLIGQRTNFLESSFYQQSGLNNPLIQVPVALGSYIQLIFWPLDLTLYHSEMTFTPSQLLFFYFILFLFFALLALSWRKNRFAFFWLLFFLISLLPTMTPLRISWIVAERYAYLGTLGILATTALALWEIGRKSRRLLLFQTVFAIILIVLLIRTIDRNRDWANQDNLWLATAKTSPSSPQNHNNLGDLYARRGDLEKAAEEFQIAINLKSNYGDAYHNLANIYQQMGKEELAIENYQKALSFNKALWPSLQNLAAIYFKRGQLNLAQENLEKAIAINPKNSQLFLNLAKVFLKNGDQTKARQALERAAAIDPKNPQIKDLLLSL